ncbi:potassium-transporting ATPase subunit C [Mycobacterium sp. 1274761.0]|uniref:potassium-transporting ATPase subunit C n=1 Tax=Mycobacterium sp. 1274761.0 TaxID=1834077 RepID=UPI0007FC3795|nr:potassium-transporting ATPase subunit C [Mycobacterium sp. 1274761.0]OBK80105.1 K+-transporting ATPase subunit C [Mycobacterium sp. 1274761.0]
MKPSNTIRQHWAALRALLVLTAILGVAYPALIWVIAQLPGLRAKAEGSIIVADGRPVGSSLIGQSFTGSDGNPLPQYFQGRPSAAGDGYDPLSTGASNLGPESIVDTPEKPSLLTLVCSRSAAVGGFEGVDGSRPFCTGGGVGAVLSVIGPRDAHGVVVHPLRVVSVNEPCETTPVPFLNVYGGVRVECARSGDDYRIGQLVPIRGNAPAQPAVPADAVTAGGSGLDPHISIAYADLQVNRVARARGVSPADIREAVVDNTDQRWLGFFGEPTVNVLKLNLELDQKYPAKS